MMMDEQITEFLSLPAASSRFGISEHTLRNATDLPKIRINNRVIRVRAAEVADWIKRHEVLA